MTAIDPSGPLPRSTPPQVSGDLDASTIILQRLRTHLGGQSRYQVRGEVARGGMGLILRVWDEDLRRELAMKVVLGQKGQAALEDIPPKVLGRFLEEAQVTGQLDHPGIVPVHELAIDAVGGVFFTMRLVRGRDLKEIIELVHAGRDGWTLTRALWAMLKVCDAMAYAHSKGVIHRDLKPANVMVGRFGEVYVMDWGLARVLGTPDRHDLRLRREETAHTLVQSERRADASHSADSVLFTMDGDVVGTPAYMAPEQARGEIERLGPRSDVYSVGAMLYHLLTGEMPFVQPGMQVSQHMVLRWALEGPPRPVHEIREEVPAELVAICEKAMSRDLAQRYADMGELGADLQAYLENRVVKAYRTGAWVEFRKWVRRNRGLASAWLAAIVLALGGLAATVLVESRGRRIADRERGVALANEQLAKTNMAEAQRQEEIARRERANVLRLSAFQVLEDLESEADRLWPATPDNVEAYQAWTGRADQLLAGLRPSADGSDIGHLAQLETLRARTAPDPAGPVRAASDDDLWWRNQLEKLVSELEAFADPERGLVRGIDPEHGWGIERRLQFARTVELRSIGSPRARELWSEASAAISDPASPFYPGLELAPQLGLIPLGRDPGSGLLEFADVQTGDPPVRNSEGRLDLDEGSGVVFVLVPGGTFAMGAQGEDVDAPNYDPASDPMAEPKEGPVHEITLEPFLISKYELTQGQWLACWGGNPSKFAPGSTWGGRAITPRNPVEQVSWEQAMNTCRRLGWNLPTEAQWEYAARALTDSPWWIGEDASYLGEVANLSDRYARAHGSTWKDVEDGLDDGHLVHAPVGSFEANPFGLHDVIGNVYEWCREGVGSYRAPVAGAEGAREHADPEGRIVRGGGFISTARGARSAKRDSALPGLLSESIGLRPVRPLSR